MGLFGGHYLVHNEIFTIGIQEYGIPIGYVHPVAFLRGIEPFNISTCMRMIDKTIDMFRYYATVLLMKVINIFFNSSGNPNIQKNHFVRPSLCFARSHGMVVSVASMASRSAMSRLLWCSLINCATVSSKVSPGLRRLERAAQVLGVKATLLFATSAPLNSAILYHSLPVWFSKLSNLDNLSNLGVL